MARTGISQQRVPGSLACGVDGLFLPSAVTTESDSQLPISECYGLLLFSSIVLKKAFERIASFSSDQNNQHILFARLLSY